MTAPNLATLWGETIVDSGLAESGLDAVCVAPGWQPFDAADGRLRRPPRRRGLLPPRRALGGSLLRARSLSNDGRAHRAGLYLRDGGRELPPRDHRGRPVASPAGRVDGRPARRTARQRAEPDRRPDEALRRRRQGVLRTLPEPAAEERRLRSVRTTVCRAVATSTGTPPGPVHLNVPVAKPLEPTATPDGIGSIPDSFAASDSLGSPAAMVRSSPRRRANRACATRICSRRASAVDDADRGFIVAGPTNRPTPARGALTALAEATGFPVLADPLSGVRFRGPRRRRHGLWRLRLLPRRRRRRWPDRTSSSGSAHHRRRSPAALSA